MSAVSTSVYGSGCSAVFVYEPDCVEHLHRLVRVEASEHLRDRVQVPVDELAEPAVVVDRARSRAPRDEQFESGYAEGVLNVHGHEADAQPVVRRPLQLVLARPGFGRRRPLLVRDPPDEVDALGVEMGRDRQHAA